MPKLRAAMHLDTVLTFADRDLVTIYRPIMDQVHAITLRPSSKPVGIEATIEKKPFIDVVAEALNLKKLRVIETGGDHYANERAQWDSGNNLVALSPAWSSPTTATPGPTRSCARQASKSSPSQG